MEIVADAEARLIGSIIVKQEGARVRAERALALIRPRHLIDEDARTVFEAIQYIIVNDPKVEPSADVVIAELVRRGVCAKVRIRVTEFFESVAGPANLEHFLNAVLSTYEERTARKKQLLGAQKLSLIAKQVSAGFALDLDELHQAQRLVRAQPGVRIQPISDFVMQEVERFKDGVPTLPSSWQRLDRFLGGGFVIPSLVVLGAQPKIGKSTFAQIIAERHVRAGGVALYIDTELGRGEFIRRLLYRASGLSYGTRIQNLGYQESQAFRDAVVDFTEEGIGKRWVREDDLAIARLTPQNIGDRIGEVLRYADELKAKKEAFADALLVVVDSLQKLPMANLDHRRSAIDAWIRALEAACARHQRLVILAISEVARDGDGYRSGMSAFKESSGVEFGAHLAMVMKTQRAAGHEDAQRPIATLEVVANRYGRRGEVACYQTAPACSMKELQLQQTAVRSPGPSNADGPNRKNNNSNHTILHFRGPHIEPSDD